MRNHVEYKFIHLQSGYKLPTLRKNVKFLHAGEMIEAGINVSANFRKYINYPKSGIPAKCLVTYIRTVVNEVAIKIY